LLVRIAMSVRHWRLLLVAEAYLGVFAVAAYGGLDLPGWFPGWAVFVLAIALHVVVGIAFGRAFALVLPILAFAIIAPSQSSDNGYYGPSDRAAAGIAMIVIAPLLVLAGVIVRRGWTAWRPS
jgi:hypothetical protein